ncbi:ATP-binding protein/SpoIIE family protein phosphatase [Streptomyces laculatispora]|uniref:ATP-binding protein/SpoIIE family protein phosphatase n=1 Tax=Streptomyces laculatispora TaxID=887464 RepID=A0ABY9I112_9ACTN|nr:ATP-binding SpoIIE family protein phosphatase [Streptomyces laculatispora]WLQ40518.1 ATP-binding protein/SpoIIE family protein phosphatase [Streptomyces laculatispora]
MGPVNAPRGPLLVDCEDMAWFRDQPEAARGAAAALGRRIGLGEQRTAELVLAVSELASNIVKHAVDGSLLLRTLRTREVAGVEVVVVDTGPGMADVPAALRDGTSSTGTLGIGLGAVQRLADSFDIHSRPGQGTVQLARFWPRPTPPSLTSEPVVGGITRPIGSERICGDAWAARTDTGEQTTPRQREETSHPQSLGAARLDWSAMTATPRPEAPVRTEARGRSVRVHAADPGPGRGVLVMSCDGLGHGPLAALAAQAAVQAFRTGDARTPEQAMQQVHKALRGTRGAAVAIARLEGDGRVLFCGTGNITAALVTATTRSNLLSHPGIVGHQMHQLRTYEHHLPAHGALVMHSDGLSGRWRPADLADLLPHQPALIATGLLRLAGTRRDDASAVIAKAAR